MADLIVIGAGHAGCEAALAAARMGIDTLLLTLNMDGIALMACNPVIGGSAKGHLVRELDALGGEMGLAIDDTFLQSRMLNMGKGPAVHSLRAQADKQAYQNRMRKALMTCGRLTVRQGEAASIETENNRVTAVTTATGARIPCRAVVVATGVYLKGSIIIGEHRHDGGPQGLMNASLLSASLTELGFELRRFKTGTPARVDVRTVDFDEMQEQKGDDPVVPFSFMTDRKLENTYSCYLTWTTPETHKIILDNLDRAPLYSGKIHGIGPRYCPSIEDKVVRFADKDRHQISWSRKERKAGNGMCRACPPPCRRMCSGPCTGRFPDCGGASSRGLATLLNTTASTAGSCGRRWKAYGSAGSSSPGRSTAPAGMRKPRARACWRG